MASKADPPITAEQAARLIYRTEAPHPGQVGAVCSLMQRGDLKPCSQRRFTTTRGAVAEYLAAEELRRAELHRGPANAAAAANGKPARRGQAAASRSRAGESNTRRLRLVYRELLNDYFRSVVFCGRVRDRSPQFRRAVLGLQIVVLLLLVGIGGWTLRTMLAGEPLIEARWMRAGRLRLERHNAGEKRVVEAWLRANRDSAELLDLLPGHARPGGKALRARFRWRLADHTTRLDDHVFILQGGEIVRIEESDTADNAVEQRLTGT